MVSYGKAACALSRYTNSFGFANLWEIFVQLVWSIGLIVLPKLLLDFVLVKSSVNSKIILKFIVNQSERSELNYIQNEIHESVSSIYTFFLSHWNGSFFGRSPEIIITRMSHLFKQKFYIIVSALNVRINNSFHSCLVNIKDSSS